MIGSAIASRIAAQLFKTTFRKIITMLSAGAVVGSGIEAALTDEEQELYDEVRVALNGQNPDQVFQQMLYDTGQDLNSFSEEQYAEKREAYLEQLLVEYEEKGKSDFPKVNMPDGSTETVESLLPGEEINPIAGVEEGKAVERKERQTAPNTDDFTELYGLDSVDLESYPEVYGARQLFSSAYLGNAQDEFTYYQDYNYVPFAYLGVQDTSENFQGMFMDTTNITAGIPRRGLIGFEPLSYFEEQQAQTNTATGRLAPYTDENIMLFDQQLEDETGLKFVRKEAQNVPFTFADATAIYDAQTPDIQRLIAQSLALNGSDRNASGQSYMQQAVGLSMFTDPDLMYERDSVLAALMSVSTVSEYEQALNVNEPTFVGDKYIPDLRENDFSDREIRRGTVSVNDFQDDLFDLAVRTDAVSKITPLVSEKLFDETFIALTGRTPDAQTKGMIEGWTRDFQRENIGNTRLSNYDFSANYENEIETNFEDKVKEKNDFDSMNVLGKILKRVI